MKQMQSICRRQFTKTCACTLALLPFCCTCRAKAKGDTDNSAQTYYPANREKFLKLIDSMRVAQIEVLQNHVDKQAAAKILVKTRDNFIGFLPQIPYIGGDDNPHTLSLVTAAYQMKFFAVLRDRGMSMRRNAKISYDIIYKFWDSFPGWKKWAARTFLVTKGRFRKMEKLSRQSTSPYDWKMEYVKGDGETFDFGANIHQCGIVKMYKDNGMEQFTPYLCMQDFASHAPLNIKLMRTKTLARSDMCDFRFTKNAECPSGWPPENLAEFS